MFAMHIYISIIIFSITPTLSLPLPLRSVAGVQLWPLICIDAFVHLCYCCVIISGEKGKYAKNNNNNNNNSNTSWHVNMRYNYTSVGCRLGLHANIVFRKTNRKSVLSLHAYPHIEQTHTRTYINIVYIHIHSYIWYLHLLLCQHVKL